MKFLFTQLSILTELFGFFSESSKKVLRILKNNLDIEIKHRGKDFKYFKGYT